MTVVTVTGKFTVVSDDVVGFAPDRNAPAGIPPMVLVPSFAQCPGVPVGHLVTPGKAVTMSYDTTTKLLSFPFDRWKDVDITSNYPDDTITLALVQSVTRQTAVVNIHPTHTITMSREDFSGNPKDVLDNLLSVGDILAVRLYRGPNGQLRVRANDVDPDEDPVMPAPVLVEGGVPWLDAPTISSVVEIVTRFTAERQKVADANDAMAKLAVQFDTDIEQLREALAGIGTTTGEITLPSANQSEKQRITDAISAMATAHITRVITNYKREIQDLIRQNKELAYALDNSTDTDREGRRLLSEARQHLRELDKKVESDAAKVLTISDRRNNYINGDEWIREEMRRYWFESYAPADRARYVLDNSMFDILPSYVNTFGALDDTEMVKAIRIATHVVTGRNTAENIAEVHDLREGDGATAPSVTRDDGAVCRRVHVEAKIAQAKRFHYWKLRDGRIELSRVAQHDDFTP